MRKTILISQRVEIHTDPIPPFVIGLRPEFIDTGSPVDNCPAYADLALTHGYIDATNRIPAGYCYKVQGTLPNDWTWVYDRAVIRPC